jgi:hypothetical protein
VKERWNLENGLEEAEITEPPALIIELLPLSILENMLYTSSKTKNRPHNPCIIKENYVRCSDQTTSKFTFLFSPTLQKKPPWFSNTVTAIVSNYEYRYVIYAH